MAITILVTGSNYISLSIITLQLKHYGDYCLLYKETLNTNLFCMHYIKYLCEYCDMLQKKKTPLHWASERGYIHTVTILLAYGGDIEAQDEVI